MLKRIISILTIYLMFSIDGKFVCAACGIKLESYSVSHAVTKSTCAQFGLDANNFQSEWRVCANCAKLRRRRNKT